MAKTLDLPIAFAFRCFSERRSPTFGWTMKSRDADCRAVDRLRRESFYLDKRGKLRTVDHKRLSRKRGGALRGQGWKYGSGFVDGVFPVLSPVAQQLLRFLQEVTDVGRIHACLDALPPTHDTWDDLINVSVQLRLNKQWDPIILIGEWISQRSSFRSDVMCYNLLIDAYGEKSFCQKAEKAYLELTEMRCVPTEETYALLLKAYCSCNLQEKAEAVFLEMRKHGLPPSASR